MAPTFTRWIPKENVWLQLHFVHVCQSVIGGHWGCVWGSYGCPSSSCRGSCSGSCRCGLCRWPLSGPLHSRPLQRRTSRTESLQGSTRKSSWGCRAYDLLGQFTHQPRVWCTKTWGIVLNSSSAPDFYSAGWGDWNSIKDFHIIQQTHKADLPPVKVNSKCLSFRTTPTSAGDACVCVHRGRGRLWTWTQSTTQVSLSGFWFWSWVSCRIVCHL